MKGRYSLGSFWDCCATRSARSRSYNPSAFSYNLLTSARKQMCSTALSAMGPLSFISCATTSNPLSSAGGDLHTFAVMIFWRFVAVRVFRTSRNASQILFTLDEGIRPISCEVPLAVPLTVLIPFSITGKTLVSLYIFCVTSSSLWHHR